MKKTIFIIISLILTSSAFAATGTNYTSSPEEFLSGGGSSEGSSYFNYGSIGGSTTGTASGSAYSTDIGFLSVIATYATSEADIPTLATGTVYNFPNPFSPTKNLTTAIAYNLSSDANVTVYIFNSLGQQIWKRDYAAGETPGGSFGYNEISWDGRTNGGSLVSNDIYFCVVTADNRILGRGKIAVLK